MANTQINGKYQIQNATVGTAQVDATIIVAAGTHAFTASQSMGGFLLTNVGTPVNPNDAVNKQYVDASIQGLNQKPTARVATTAALPGTYAYNNGASGVGATLTAPVAGGVLTIDGVGVVINDVVLIKNQASTFQNGLYVVSTAGAVSVSAVLTRQVDMDQPAEFSGAFIPVANEGTTQANTLWLSNNLGAVVVGTTAVSFTQLAAPGSYTGANGIQVVGTVISPVYGTISNTVAQGNDPRIIGGLQLAKVIKRETPSGTINGSNTSFSLANTPVVGSEEVYLNGVQQDSGAGNDYTISGAVITYLSAPLSGDKIRVSYISA